MLKLDNAGDRAIVPVGVDLLRSLYDELTELQDVYDRLKREQLLTHMCIRVSDEKTGYRNDFLLDGILLLIEHYNASMQSYLEDIEAGIKTVREALRKALSEGMQ